MADPGLDGKRVQAFARKIFGLYTSGFVALLVDLGHRMRLLDAMATGPGTSEEIARRAGCNERYVREWLAGMATAEMIEYDAATRRFTLPAEHAVCLTGPSSRNLAPTSQNVTLLAKRLERVAQCFRNGGGVSYAEYQPDFSEAQALPRRKTPGQKLHALIKMESYKPSSGRPVNLITG